MNFILKINQESCIACGRCVRICTSKIFTQEGESKKIEIENPENCISCGHCVAVCPTDSITHSLFPASKLHAIKREKLPTAEQILLLCQSRRSNRAFSKVEIPVSTLDLILEAAHRAPTAMNSQQVYFTLITNPKDLQKISKFTIDTFCGLMKKMEHPLLKPLLKPFLGGVYKMLPKFRKLKAEYDQGKDLILRNATAVILIHTPIESRFGCQDANLAYQNASLMAESLCVGHFYMGFVCTAFQQDKKNKFIQSLGIKGKVHAAMALGMPEFMFTRYIDKQDISVQKIK